MKNLLITLCLLLSINVNAQEKKNFFKELYKDFLKYGTVYAAGDIKNPYENSRKDFFVERPADGDLYAIPRVVEVTEYFDFDYRNLKSNLQIHLYYYKRVMMMRGVIKVKVLR